MMHITTIVGSQRLSAGDVASASDVLAGLGAGPGAPIWIEPGQAAEIPLSGADWRDYRDRLEDALPGADIFVQPAERRRRLFVADMDSTMITVECIDELADYAGLKAEVSAVTEAAMRGEIDFAGALRQRVALLEGMDVATIEECLHARVRPTDGAETLVRTLRANGVRTLLVSGGFTHFADPVAASLGFDAVRANVLETSGGTLTGRVQTPIVDSTAKAAAVVDLARAVGATTNEAIAIGDGANDLKMIETAGLGIAYHAKPILAAAADARIRHGKLTAILYAIGIPRSRWTVA